MQRNETRIRELEDMANLLRLHSLEMTTTAGSGHPTTCLSSAEIISVLFFEVMHRESSQTGGDEFGRSDEFVLSKGHGAPILYAALAEAGDIPPETLITLRHYESPLEGHPVPRLPGVRIATGSLGQGLSAGAGLALALKMDSIRRRVYVLLGDGEMAEGNVLEALNLSPYLGLNNLCAVVDVNSLGQSDPTVHEWDLEAYRRQGEAFGWKVLSVDGHSVEQLLEAFQAAESAEQPSLILARTVKGKGLSSREDKNGFHGKEVAREELDTQAEEIRRRLHSGATAGRADRTAGGADRADLAHALSTAAAIEKSPGLPQRYEQYARLSLSTSYEKGAMAATRDAYGRALAKLGAQEAQMVVLDGDVKNSTRTASFFEQFPERSFESYIAEQNMLGLAMGLQAGGKRVFVATFAAFLARAHDQIRMASYTRADLKLAGSHTGVGIGQDGPSQMGLEDLAMMRSIHGSVVLSPADAVAAEKLTCEAANFRGISYLRTMRQKTPVIYDNEEQFPIGGSKTLRSSGEDRAAVIATGATLPEALSAARELAEEGTAVRVLDCYSIKPIDEPALRQAAAETGALITVEDHYPEGGLGEAVAAALGSPEPGSGQGRQPNAPSLHILAVRRMPHSGAPDMLYREQGLDKQSIKEAVRRALQPV
jgi:transketolase